MRRKNCFLQTKDCYIANYLYQVHPKVRKTIIKDLILDEKG